MDEFLGRNGIPSQSIATETRAPLGKTAKVTQTDTYNTTNLAKPQLKFNRKPDNSNVSPWRPLLRSKPNAEVPLDDEFLQDNVNLSPTPNFPHPYRHEIAHISYPERLFKNSEPIRYGSLEETPVQWVVAQKDMDDLLEDLKHVTEFAVDLEHHDYRTYYGFLCLMQISTRTKDYIIDTLLLREELEVLNEVFTDSSIVKVSSIVSKWLISKL